MPGNISDYAQVNISATGATPTQQGFGLPLITSFTAAWTERTREYASLTAVAVDFAVGTPEYLAAQAVFGQNPRPPKVLIGRCALKPTQQFEVTPNAALALYGFKFNLNGSPALYTSDGTPTAAEITGGLKTAVDALALAVTTSQQAGNTVLRILANSPGAWFDYKTLDRANMSVVQNHADPGIATDLAAIALERNDWYGLITTFNSAALVEAAAAYCNANKKLYVAQTIDTPVPETVKSGTDDVAEFLQNAANDYTALIYSDGVSDFVDAGAMGARFPKKPGRATWMFTQLSGVPASSFTDTERAHLKAKNCGWYEATSGVPILNEGKLASGRFIDFRIFLDYFGSRTQTRIFTMETQNDKVPQTDVGISQISSCVRAQIGEDSAGVNAPVDPATVVVTEPLITQISDSDRQNRILNGITFSFRYTSAWHSAIVNGVVSL
jgi:hypothetical protein